MKRRITWTTGAVVVIALGWAVAQLLPAHTVVADLFPDNALLYIEARDFRTLLTEWNGSDEKKSWVKSDNYAGLSRSRLFGRLEQAQGEFAAAATTSPDASFLSTIAGTESGLALYDIGNLEFVYVTRLSEAAARATPLWQAREKFELRTEGAAQFYVRQDQQSNRTAAFALRDGWLILGTRADLVAGVLDRLQGAKTHGLKDETWYADALKAAAGSDQDMRMVLDLEKIVPSPYFRSYWVQRNISEMKQYRAAICDLHRSHEAYTEDRVLLRKPGMAATASGDVRALLAMAPTDAVSSSAQASPGVEQVLAEMRENILDMKSAQSISTWSAPAGVSAENAGTADMLEERIDVAPVILKKSDPYRPLHTLLGVAQPVAIMTAHETRARSNEMFVRMDHALVLQAAAPWNERDVQSALSAAIQPGLTASQLGVGWKQQSGSGGSYATIDGPVAMAMAVRNNLLFLSTDESLLSALLSKQKPELPALSSGVTYAATFQHSGKEQQTYRKVVTRLDAASHGAGATNATGADVGGEGEQASDQAPAFFSRNIASLIHMFRHVARERVEERDEGAAVRQKAIYEWQRP